MKKNFPFVRSPRVAAMDSPTSPESSGLGAKMPHYQDQDMGGIHKAASEGNLWRIKKILLFRKSSLDDRDCMSRTALHVACGKGHPEVVRLLIRRRCQLNLMDLDNKTALIHAVQHEQEECANILLDHGANPNVRDIHGNTALHYAVLGHNTAMVEKLISRMEYMEAINKDGFTPLSLAQYENKESMVEFLETRSSRAHQIGGKQQPTSEEKEERRPLESSESNNFVTTLQKSLKQAWSRIKSKKVCEKCEEDSLRRDRIPLWCCTFYCKRRIAASDNVVKVAEENTQTSHEREVSANTHAGANDGSDRSGLRQQSSNEQTDTQQPNDKINEKAVVLVNKVEEQKKQKKSKRKVSGDRHDGAKDNSKGVGVWKKSNTKQNDKQQIPHKKTKDSNRNGFPHWCCGFYRNRRIGVVSDSVVYEVERKKKQTRKKKKLSANMYDGVGEDSDRNGLRHQRNSKQTDNQKPNYKVKENMVFLMNKEPKTSKKVSENMYDGAKGSDVLSQHSKREHTDNQQPNDKINENTAILMNKVEEKKEHGVGMRQKSNSKPSEKLQLPIMENEESNGFVFSRKLTLQKEKEKRQKAYFLYTENMAQLGKKKRQSMKAVEMNPKVENTIETQGMALKTVRENKVVEEQNYTQMQLSQEQNTSILQDEILTKHPCEPKGTERAHKKVIFEVSDSYEKQKCQLHENHMLKDEIAKLTLELDTVKNQMQEMGKTHFEDSVNVNKKHDHLKNTITETLFQHNEQLEVLRTELTMLSTKQEDEKQNRGMLEAESDTYRSRQDTVIQYHEHRQASKGGLQVAFKTEKEEWFCSQDKKNSDMSNLTYNIRIISQELSKFESKFNHLEMELHHLRGALRERTLVLEGDEGDQSQTQNQKKIEHARQQEQGKVNKDTEKQESLQDRLSQLESEIKLLQQQLDQANNKADMKRKRVIKIQDQLADTMKILEANSENQGLMLKETCKELINEWHLLKESIHQYENDKAERDAVVRQLQGEMADIQRKLSSLEALLKIESHHRMDSQYKIQELRKELDEIRRQFQHEKEESKQYIDLIRSLEQSLHEVMKQKSDLEKSMTRFKEPLNMPERNFNEENSFPRNVNTGLIEMAMETRRVQQEAVVRQLQGEMADIQRKLSSTETLLKTESHHHMDSQYKIQELQKELDETRRQFQHEKEQSKKNTDLIRSLEQSLHEVMKQKSDLEKSMTRFKEPLNMPERNFNEENSFPRNVNTGLIETAMETRRVQQEAVVRQLQGDLVDTQRKLSSTEALLKIQSHHHMDSQYKIQELQKELDETRRQFQHEKEESKKYTDLIRSLNQRLHEVMKQKSDLEKSTTRFKEPLNMPERNFNEENSLPRDLSPRIIAMAMETKRIQKEVDELVAASKSMHYPKENIDQLDLEYLELHKKSHEMMINAQWCRQETIRVRREMEIRRVKHEEEMRRIDRIGECENPYVAYRLEQVRQTFQF